MRFSPEELQQWIEERKRDIEWPATHSDIYTYIFKPHGVEDEKEQKALMEVCINRRFFIRQTKEEMSDKQRNPRLKLNEEIFLPF